MIDAAHAVTPLTRVLADAEFDSELNHQHVRALGATSVIPAKRGKLTWRISGVRAQMRQRFPRRQYRRGCQQSQAGSTSQSPEVECATRAASHAARVDARADTDLRVDHGLPTAFVRACMSPLPQASAVTAGITAMAYPEAKHVTNPSTPWPMAR